MSRSDESMVIPKSENLTVEFKSDRDGIHDNSIIESVVALTNTEGGTLFLGVEDDGTPTGAHKKHLNLHGLVALIRNRTHPHLSVEIEQIANNHPDVVAIRVPKSREVIATSDGTVRKRQLKHDGTPENVAMFPTEIPRRISGLGGLDISEEPCIGANASDLDAVERERVRRVIVERNGDKSLLPLSDEDLDKVLGFVTNVDGRSVPTVAGMLYIGKEKSIEKFVPTHEVGIQSREGTKIKINDFLKWPILRIFERAESVFAGYYREDEFSIGLFRQPIPNFDKAAFREALVNAFIHRDYTRKDSIFVRWEDDGIVISSPGGFMEGVMLSNLLSVEPTARNYRLTDIAKRVGIAERTGRGIDIIYEGTLRYGRPVPSYSGTTSAKVVVRIPGGQADLPFFRLVLEEEQRSKDSLNVMELLVLAALREERRISVEHAAALMQRDERIAKKILENLVEVGLIEGHGNGRSRDFTLSASVYERLGSPDAYVRQVGAEKDQDTKRAIVEEIGHRGSMTRSEVDAKFRLGETRAKRLLAALIEEGLLKSSGTRRWTRYEKA